MPYHQVIQTWIVNTATLLSTFVKKNKKRVTAWWSESRLPQLQLQWVPGFCFHCPALWLGLQRLSERLRPLCDSAPCLYDTPSPWEPRPSLLLHVLTQWTHVPTPISLQFIPQAPGTKPSPSFIGPVGLHLDCNRTIALSTTLLKISSFNKCILNWKKKTHKTKQNKNVFWKDEGGTVKEFGTDLYTLLIYCLCDVIYLCGCAGLSWLWAGSLSLQQAGPALWLWCTLRWLLCLRSTALWDLAQ